MTTALVPLREVLREARPGFASGDNLESGLFQIRMNNLSRDGRLILDKRRRVSADHKQASRSRLKPGDVLFNATNSPDLVGKTAYFPGCDEPAVYSNHFIRLRSQGDVLDPRFLTRWLQREFNRGYFAANCKQWVNQATFGKDRLEAMKIPLPPIEEQRRIAAVLDAADVLRTKRRQALAKLNTLTQSIFIDMFGDPAVNPRNWTRRPLGELLLTGPQNGIYKASKLYGAGVKILRIDSFYDGKVTDVDDLKRVRLSETEVDTYGLAESDIVINRVNSRSHLGKSALVPPLQEPVAFESNMMRLRLNDAELLPRFAVELLQTRDTKNQILAACKDAVNQSSINQGDVRKLMVMLPPMSIQRRFTEAANLVASEMTKHRSDVDRLASLFASLQQRAFRGEL